MSTPRTAVELTLPGREGGGRVGNLVQISNANGVIGSDNLFDVRVVSETPPENFVYKFLTRTSGPQSASGLDYELNTNSGTGTPAPSVFEYEVPSGKEFVMYRINFEIVDDSMRYDSFAGIGVNPLTNGCLLEIIDSDGTTVVLNFHDGTTIKQNSDLATLAGVDTSFDAAAGPDFLPIRFTIANAGSKMLLSAGRRVRWTNQDNLSSINHFTIMVQGILRDA